MERFSRRDGRVAAAEAGCTFDLPPHSLLFCEVGGPSRPAVTLSAGGADPRLARRRRDRGGSQGMDFVSLISHNPPAAPGPERPRSVIHRREAHGVRLTEPDHPSHLASQANGVRRTAPGTRSEGKKPRGDRFHASFGGRGAS
jgi:hypothetical protein